MLLCSIALGYVHLPILFFHKMNALEYVFQEAMNIEAMKYRAKEKERDQLLEKQNTIRNEIKANPFVTPRYGMHCQLKLL